MENLALIALYGVIGTLEDFVISLYYDAIARRKAIPAASISFVHTLLAIFVVGSIIVSKSPWLLLSYSLGGAIGTFAGVKNNRRKP